MARERLRVDRIAADAIASDDAQLAALADELRAGDARSADHQRLIVRECRGGEPSLLRRDDRPGEPRFGQQGERRRAEHGLAFRIEEVSAEADFCA